MYNLLCDYVRIYGYAGLYIQYLLRADCLYGFVTS